MARYFALSPNARAALDMIAWSEATSTSPITIDDGYDIIVSGVNGHERFDGYSRHPFAMGRKPKQINFRGLYSTASGRYQYLLRTWNYYSAMLGIHDFSPESQDKVAWFIIRERNAETFVEAGMMEDAIRMIAPIWASLPGKGYQDQWQRTMPQCLAAFELNGGHLYSLPFSPMIAAMDVVASQAEAPHTVSEPMGPPLEQELPPLVLNEQPSVAPPVETGGFLAQLARLWSSWKGRA